MKRAGQESIAVMPINVVVETTDFPLNLFSQSLQFVRNPLSVHISTQTQTTSTRKEGESPIEQLFFFLPLALNKLVSQEPLEKN